MGGSSRPLNPSFDDEAVRAATSGRSEMDPELVEYLRSLPIDGQHIQSAAIRYKLDNPSALRNRAGPESLANEDLLRDWSTKVPKHQIALLNRIINIRMQSVGFLGVRDNKYYFQYCKFPFLAHSRSFRAKSAWKLVTSEQLGMAGGRWGYMMAILTGAIRVSAVSKPLVTEPAPALTFPSYPMWLPGQVVDIRFGHPAD